MLAARFNYIVIAVLALLGGVGCHRADPQPPPDLQIAQLGPVLQQAFASANPELKTEVGDYARAMQSQDWPTAMSLLRELRSSQDLTPDQKATLVRAQLTTVKQLNESADKGDNSAAAVMSSYKASK